jgi:MFS family permease
LLVGLVCLLLSIEKGSAWGWTSGSTVGLFVAAALTLGVWFVVELRVSDPLVDLRMMKLRGVWTTNLVGLAFGFAMYGSFVLVPMLLELPKSTNVGFGLSASDASLYLLPAALGMLIFAPLSGVLDRRFGAKLPLALGTIIALAAALVPAVAHNQAWEIGLTFVLLGSGLGLAWAAMANAIVAAVAASQTSVATGMNSIMRQIGASIGTAIVGAILSWNLGPHGAPTNDGFTIGFWGIAIVLTIALLAALLVPGRSAQNEGRS